MILKRFYDDGLAQASYLIGCAATAEALVVDPHRDVGRYLAAAEAEGLRVAHVTETHIHADFVSGSRELAQRAGARLYLSDEGPADWKYGFAAESGAVPLRDGDEIVVGNIRVRAVHTPGHTPEHLTFLVTDGAAADRPVGALTGDFLFVGDVGRPDLLERAAGAAGTMEAAARDLFRSLERFRAEQPDWLQIWPGHGAGSACGKGIGSMPQSTLGYEALFNWAFSIDEEDRFVRAVLAGQPEPPPYFAVMKRINRDGPPPVGEPAPLRQVEAEQLAALLDRGAMIVDLRPANVFGATHLPGTLNIPLNRAFPTWAGSLLPYDRDIYLIGEAGAAEDARRALAMIGLDGVEGFADPAIIARLEADGRPTARTPRLEAAAAARDGGMSGGVILDVRGAAEREALRIPGSVHVPLARLRDRVDELPTGGPVYVHCASGSRSAIATSVLEAAGVAAVDLTGGIEAWREAGGPVEASAPAEQVVA